MPAPAHIFRSYHLKWNYHAAALSPVLFGFCLSIYAWSAQSHSGITWLTVALFFAVGIIVSAYTISAQVRFTQDSIQQRSLFSRHTMPVQTIRGRRDYTLNTVESVEKFRILVSSDPAAREMSLSDGYNFDAAFFAWFNSLPDLGKA